MPNIRKWLHKILGAYDEESGALLVKLGEGGVTITADIIDLDVEAITGEGAGAKSLADVVAKLSGDPATQTTLAAILAKLIAGPATEATLAKMVGTTLVQVSGALPNAGHVEIALGATKYNVLVVVPASVAPGTLTMSLLGVADANSPPYDGTMALKIPVPQGCSSVSFYSGSDLHLLTASIWAW